MGVFDWLSGKIGEGLGWLKDNVGKPAMDVLRKVPVVDKVVQAAQPILDVAGKIPGALQGKEKIGLRDVGRAALAVPGTIAAAKSAVAQVPQAVSQLNF